MQFDFLHIYVIKQSNCQEGKSKEKNKEKKMTSSGTEYHIHIGNHSTST